MNLPIDTCDDGATAFAIRVGQDKHTYPANIGRGGGHYPATSVCVVYQLGRRMREGGAVALSERRMEQLPADRELAEDRDRGDGDL